MQYITFLTSKSELGGSSKSNDCAICNPIKIQIRQLVDDIDEALGRVSHVKRWELIMYMFHIIRKVVPKRICRQHNKIPRSNICFSKGKICL